MARTLTPSPDTADVKRRLVIALGHMHPGQTEFSMDEIMEALAVIGELSSR